MTTQNGEEVVAQGACGLITVEYVAIRASGQEQPRAPVVYLWRAYIGSDRTKFGTGDTEEEAIGSLWKHWYDLFALKSQVAS